MRNFGECEAMRKTVRMVCGRMLQGGPRDLPAGVEKHASCRREEQRHGNGGGDEHRRVAEKSFHGLDLSIPSAVKSLSPNRQYDLSVMRLAGRAALPAPIDWMNESPAMKNSMIMRRPVEKRIMAVLSAIKSRICLFFLLTPWFPVIELTSEECGICCAPRAKCGVPSSG